MTDEAHPQAAERLFQMTQELHFSTPLVSRSRADIELVLQRGSLELPESDHGVAWHLCGIGIKD